MKFIYFFVWKLIKFTYSIIFSKSILKYLVDNSLIRNFHILFCLDLKKIIIIFGVLINFKNFKIISVIINLGPFFIWNNFIMTFC